jgi:D-lactate dehydrogenase
LDLWLKLHDLVKFIREQLLDRLNITPTKQTRGGACHCSTQHLGEAQGLIDIVRRCTSGVVIPEGIHCCGFAGDKGFATPKLNDHALRSLKSAVQYCEEGISTCRTCEIRLSQHGGIDYHGLVYLLDRVSQARRC